VQLDWLIKNRVVGGLPVIHAPEVKEPLHALGSFENSRGISPVPGFQFWSKSEPLGLNSAQPLYERMQKKIASIVPQQGWVAPTI
jgi:hypothetical protein